MKAQIFYKFQGNIEGDFAICNISECTQFSESPNQMLIPAMYCEELPDSVIAIEKKLFNKLEREKKLSTI